jgi:hypothetical protein
VQTKRANTPALDATRADQQMRDAAPDLLAALRDMVRYEDLPEAEQQPAVDRARAAIAKAEAR